MKNFSAVLLSAIAVVFAVPQVVMTARDGRFALCALFVAIVLVAIRCGIGTKEDIEREENQQNLNPHIFD